ncbi:hypothetical protein F7725_023577 [Dissostichus mawsoni]|uniref:Uncharacterized protein n=1 Tax=Dissostichus mawsoni TaxID=36200 RepID=A0A7J5XWX3_DISMA|nr:hypothetical protein F7725_023577 [Dissostichus mawsoni]
MSNKYKRTQLRGLAQHEGVRPELADRPVLPVVLHPLNGSSLVELLSKLHSDSGSSEAFSRSSMMTEKHREKLQKRKKRNKKNQKPELLHPRRYRDVNPENRFPLRSVNRNICPLPVNGPTGGTGGILPVLRSCFPDQ